MILNAYAVLDGFLSVLRLTLGLLVFALALPAWWRCGRHARPEARTALEDRSYLLFLLATVLLVISVVSWPLLYLLLQSYVHEWPSVMCIYGVTQVGTRSLGASRFLPRLLITLQVTKVALVFLSGAWLGLHLLNRWTRTGALMGSVLGALTVLGILALADGSAEMAYLAIPKKEEFLSAGCCSAAGEEGDQESRYAAQSLLGEGFHPWLKAAYYGVNLGMILALFGCTILGGRNRALRWTTPLLFGTSLALVVSGVFLVEIAAPALLRLPYHHCAYCLLPKVPESILAIVLFLLGAFGVGWAAAFTWFANCPETIAFLASAVRGVLAIALAGFLGSLVMLSLELWLA